jgi:hypothetical protein
MEKGFIPLLEKIKIKTGNNQVNSDSGCCGGSPVNNTEACCKLDEDKKATGEEGCGCNSPETSSQKTSCC